MKGVFAGLLVLGVCDLLLLNAVVVPRYLEERQDQGAATAVTDPGPGGADERVKGAASVNAAGKTAAGLSTEEKVTPPVSPSADDEAKVASASPTEDKAAEPSAGEEAKVASGPSTEEKVIEPPPAAKPEPAPGPAAKPEPAPASPQPPPPIKPLLFDTGQAKLQMWAQKRLRPVAEALRRRPSLRLVISGHADQRGSAEENHALSVQRAEAVAAHLRSLGVAASQIEARGFGASRPRDSHDTPTAWATNRRVELVWR